MKKKVLSVLLSTAMVATMFAGCGSKKDEAASTDSTKDDAATEDTADEGDKAEDSGDAAPAGDMHFEIVSKGFQHAYWQAVKKGADNKAKELGVTINFVGPNTESDIADQVQMLNNAINAAPSAIGFAALDTQAALDAIQTAMDSGIPIIGFDSGVSGAPDGAVLANASTDNYAAGELAAEKTYEAIKDTIANASGTVRIGVLSQDATSESVGNRGLGFIDKFAELAKADGKTVAVIGNDKYVNDAKAETVAEADADIIIEVAVPAQTTVELCATEASVIMNKADTIGMFGSNQVAAEGILTANDNLNKLGTDPETTILAAGFDAGSVIKGAIKDGKMYGAVTQSPLAMGITTVQTLYAIANGETVGDIPTEGYWYNTDNMEARATAAYSGNSISLEF